MGDKIRHAVYAILEKILRWAIHPRLRAILLKLLGADVGSNARVHEVQLFNLKKGFRNLHIGNGVFIGPRCLLDLEGPLFIGERSTLSPGVIVLTHQDPGTFQRNRLHAHYPAFVTTTIVGKDCWIGTNSTIIPGVTLGNCVMVGASSVVTRDFPDHVLIAGLPAQVKREFSRDSQVNANADQTG